METEHCGLLIVGAGHAGSELAIAARQNGWPGTIVLLGEETALPYHRPPLSKAYLCGKSDLEALALRPAAAYDAARVTLRLGARLASIDRGARTVTLADGTRLAYDKLALCTGGRARPFSCAGIDPQQPPPNLFYLRTLADADGMRAQLQPGARVAIIGGGYVGLEVAASARGLGAQVTVLEAQPRVLARVAGPDLSNFYEAIHRQEGVEILTGVAIERVETQDGRIVALQCAGNLRVPADVVIAGVGMLPNVEAAHASGLAGEGGIVVDEHSCTIDPHIVAAGDCTLHHHAIYDRQVRLESVPNALEQARAAAAWLCGKSKPNRSVPWFWSDQYELKLQMTGLSQGYDRCVLRGDVAARSFCAFYLNGDRLLAVDAVNRPGDFMLSKRMLAQPVHVDVERLADESVPLKELFSAAIAGKS